MLAVIHSRTCLGKHRGELYRTSKNKFQRPFISRLKPGRIPVQSLELLRTSQSWNDVDLPDYPQGQPELVAVKYVIPPGKKLGWHHHVAMNHGVLVQGELTIIAQDGQTKVMRAGEVVVEMVDAIHHGENRGTEPFILYMFYLSQKGMTLTVQHPEIPLM